jgi:hypothetical protein
VDATSTFTEAEWKRKPSPEVWSAADCLEHLAITETHLLDQIRSAPAASGEILAGCAGKEAIIEQRVPLRERKVQAPEGARPSGRFTNSLTEFLATRDRTIEYVRTTSDPVRQRTVPHFVFGPLDGWQWFIFMSAHTERHLRQLIEARADAQSA